MSHLLRPLIATPLCLALACTTSPADPEPSPDGDELAGDSELDGEAGKADGVDNFTFFQVAPDFRKCVFPLCGGFWVSRANRALTRCVDGSWAERCYVAEADFAPSGLTQAQIDAIRGSMHAGRVLVRGEIVGGEFGTFGTLGRLSVDEAWLAGSEGEPEGVLTRVTDSGIVCITTPCWNTLHEDKLNSVLDANFSELDLSWSGADDDAIAAAFDQVFGEHGLIVSGYRYWFWQGGWQAGRVATQFWLRVMPEAPTGECVRAGCSSHLCVAPEDAGIITTCEWQPQYACLQEAACEIQASGECGFTDTPELQACLAGVE